MKRLIAYSIFYFALLLFAGEAFAEGSPWLNKKKTITKSYPLNANSEVSIKNSFGDVKINHWNKNEVKAVITIIISSDNEALAQELFDQIWINDNNGNTVSFETKIGNNGSNSNKIKLKNKNATFHINYDVYLPEQTTLTVKNAFGNTYVNSRTGLTKLEQEYGDLKVEDLPQAELIKLSFGELKANNINVGQIKSSYSDVSIKNLGGNVDGNISFGDAQIGLASDIKGLNLNCSYGDVVLNISPSINAILDIKTSFGDFSNKSSFPIQNISKKSKYGPDFDKKFYGKTGTGKVAIKINNSYGDILLK